MKKSILIFLLLFLASCSAHTTLDYPQILTIEGEFLVWPAINGADYYVLILNNEEIVVMSNEFLISNLADDSYNAKVKAVGQGFKDSLFSPIYSFTIPNLLPEPTNLRIIEKQLMWDYSFSYDFFTVYLNDELYETDKTYFDLSFLPENMKYEIYIIANLENEVSKASKLIDYFPYENLFMIKKDVFNKANKNNYILELEISDLTFDWEKNSDFSSQDIFVQDNKIIIENSYFQEKEYGKNVLLITSSYGLIIFVLDIYDSRNPSVALSPYNRHQIGIDLIVNFNIYDKELIGISGSQISSYDYKLSKDSVIINYEYIERIFNISLTRQTIILAARFKYNDEFFEIPFYINRP